MANKTSTLEILKPEVMNNPLPTMQTAIIGDTECYVSECRYGRAILRPLHLNGTTSYSIPENELHKYLI